MAISRQQILAAIAAETAERSGPMPPWLVAVAVNAKSEGSRSAVDAELIAMRQVGLIECRGNRAQGSGLELTAAGRAALAASRQAKQGRTTPHNERSTPAPAPIPSATATTQAPPALPADRHQARAAMIAEAATKARSIPTVTEIVDHDAAPQLFALLCDLAGLVGERLAVVHAAGDLGEIRRLRSLGQRIQHHTGGPRS